MSQKLAKLIFEKAAPSKAVPQVIHPIFAGQHLPAEHLAYLTSAEASQLRALTDGKSDTTQFGPQSFTDPSQARGNTLNSTPTRTTSSPTISRTSTPTRSSSTPVVARSSTPSTQGSSNRVTSTPTRSTSTPTRSTSTGQGTMNASPATLGKGGSFSTGQGTQKAATSAKTGMKSIGDGWSVGPSKKTTPSFVSSPSAAPKNTSIFVQGTNYSPADYQAAGYNDYQQPPSRKVNDVAAADWKVSPKKDQSRIAAFSDPINHVSGGYGAVAFSPQPISLASFAKDQSRIPQSIPQSLINNYQAYQQPPNDRRLAPIPDTMVPHSPAPVPSYLTGNRPSPVPKTDAYAVSQMPDLSYLNTAGAGYGEPRGGLVQHATAGGLGNTAFGLSHVPAAGIQKYASNDGWTGGDWTNPMPVGYSADGPETPATGLGSSQQASAGLATDIYGNTSQMFDKPQNYPTKVGPRGSAALHFLSPLFGGLAEKGLNYALNKPSTPNMIAMNNDYLSGRTGGQGTVDNGTAHGKSQISTDPNALTGLFGNNPATPPTTQTAQGPIGPAYSIATAQGNYIVDSHGNYFMLDKTGAYIQVAPPQGAVA